jgi:hypothetical protein
VRSELDATDISGHKNVAPVEFTARPPITRRSCGGAGPASDTVHHSALSSSSGGFTHELTGEAGGGLALVAATAGSRSPVLEVVAGLAASWLAGLAATAAVAGGGELSLAGAAAAVVGGLRWGLDLRSWWEPLSGWVGSRS